MKNQKILISGAGIAGPTLAYWLLQHGFEPVIVEHAPALRSGGYVIDFWGLGFDVAEKMGLLPNLQRTGYKVREVRMVDDSGKIVGGFGMDAMQNMMGDRYLSLLRSDLACALYGSLGNNVRTLFGDSITAIEQDAEGVNVSFANNPPERFDLVIGADGLHSTVRKLAFGPNERYENYLGYYAAAFSTQHYQPRDMDVYVIYSVPDRQVSRFTARDDRSVFFFAFRSDQKLHVDPHDMESQKNIIKAAYRRDKWECEAIMNALERTDDLYLDVVSQVRMDSWRHGRVALLGDACGAPSLLAGQGSALAMTAAYVLAGELKHADNHATAFANYESRLHPFITRKQKAAQRFARSFVPRSEFSMFIRNHVTRWMSHPFVLRLFMGTLMTDQLSLPQY